MPLSKYIKVTIDDQQLDLKSVEDFPVSISYRLEDTENFQNKKSAEAFNVEVPATVNNDQVSNTYHNPGIEDLTNGKAFRSHRRAIIEANGYELLVGKAFLQSAKHKRLPTSYTYNFYGNNADWLIDLKESTLFDFLKDISFTFSKANIIASWAFDGTNVNLPYVFAPVRYGQPMGKRDSSGNFDDRNMLPEYMRPSLSKYWIIFWAFKSLGYRVQSDFFNTEYFRRQAMPWTWGNFLFSEGTRLDTLDFLAKSTETVSLINQDITTFLDVLATNDSTNGAFDNNGVYNYDAINFEMEWTYLPAFDYGTLDGTFHTALFVSAVATANSDVELRIKWFKNGVHVPNGNDNGNGNLMVELNAPTIGRRDFSGIVEDWLTVQVVAGDIISAKIYAHTFDSGTGIARLHVTVDAFELDYFRIPLGGTIDFQNYFGLKKHKFLDFLRGVIDEFNLSINTDTINKVVYIEPTHPYSLTDDQSEKTGGYFNEDFIDWEEKRDLSKESEMELFSESERELLFKYKDDANDGILKVVQDRFLNKLAMGKYVFPDRFKAGKKEIENRFFSPVMHYDVEQWKSITGTAPQMICLIPENISNTSREEAQNVFEPKSVYYKGVTAGMGWVFDGVDQTSFPYMFAVNYKPGGEDDPILSYSDERISGGAGSGDPGIVGKGLVRRFYHQRLAIMRNGQFYNTWMKFKNFDVIALHREHKILKGQRWEMVEIKDFKPLVEETTGCFMRKWSPIAETDSLNTFPSAINVLETGAPTETFDIKYSQLKCLSSDIPNI